MTTWPEISFQDRMTTARFDVGERAHIVVDGRKCVDCSTQQCVVACPANLFVPTSDGGSWACAVATGAEGGCWSSGEGKCGEP
jgi:ferredoxin-like protein FixX